MYDGLQMRKLFVVISVLSLLFPVYSSAGNPTASFLVDPNNTLKTSLISYWNEENANDFFSTNNLTDMNTPTYISGKVGNAVNMVRTSDQYQDGGNISALNFLGTNSFSISTCLKRSSAAATVQMIATKADSSGQGWYYQFNTANQLYLVMRNGGTGDAIAAHGSTAITDTTAYHHLVVTYNGTQSTAGMKFYYDNVLETNTVIDDSGDAESFSSNGSFQVGELTPWFTNAQDGVVDELGIWSKALTVQEISNLYNNGNCQTMTTDSKVIISGRAGVKISGTASVLLSGN